MNILDISKAVQEYKSVTGDASAASRAKNGMIQLVSVSYAAGSPESTVTEISEWIPADRFASAVRGLIASAKAA